MKSRTPGVAHHIRLLEVVHAFHELVFAVLYLAIPFRKGTWWACWAVEMAIVAYILTFGDHDTAIFARALVAAIALPALLLAAAPRFFGRTPPSGNTA